MAHDHRNRLASLAFLVLLSETSCETNSGRTPPTQNRTESVEQTVVQLPDCRKLISVADTDYAPHHRFLTRPFHHGDIAETYEYGPNRNDTDAFLLIIREFCPTLP